MMVSNLNEESNCDFSFEEAVSVLIQSVPCMHLALITPICVLHNCYEIANLCKTIK